ncbi:MAG: LysM peptidoglycan-binding domain-containing protein [Opitutales bacterium]
MVLSIRTNFLFWLVPLLCLAFLAGCPEPPEAVLAEKDETQFQRGMTYKAQGRYEEALLAFEKVIAKRIEAPESHLEAGEIYLSVMNDPILSIYHFRRFLELEPNAPEADVIRQRIETAEKLFARQLPNQPFRNEIDRLDLMDLLEAMKQENLELKKKLVTAEKTIRELRGELAELRGNPLPEESDDPYIANARQDAPEGTGSGTPEEDGETYTVQNGDTLSAISRKVYGTSARWMDIYQANRDRLASPNSLSAGQVLRIP